jgi:hypothetical protein
MRRAAGLGACILMSLGKYLDRPSELVLIYGCGGNELLAAYFCKGEKLCTITFAHGLLLSKKHEPYFIDKLNQRLQKLQG